MFVYYFILNCLGIFEVQLLELAATSRPSPWMMAMMMPGSDGDPILYRELWNFKWMEM